MCPLLKSNKTGINLKMDIQRPRRFFCDHVTVFVCAQNTLLSGEKFGPSSWQWPESFCPMCVPSLTPAPKTWILAPLTESASSSWSRPQRSHFSRPFFISGAQVSHVPFSHFILFFILTDTALLVFRVLQASWGE